MTPETRYVRNGDVHIAYSVSGEGPRDVVFLPNWISHIEHMWEDGSVRRFLERIGSFSRLIMFDRRGTGLSDRAVPVPTLEDEMGDVLAILDAVGSGRAAMVAITASAPMSMLFAATHPERASHLILYAAMATLGRTEDTPWGLDDVTRNALYTQMAARWGEGLRLGDMAPSADENFKRWYRRLERYSASPGSVLTFWRATSEIDVRRVLPAIRVPTLILHRAGDRMIDRRHSLLLEKRIPGAKRIELPGEDTLPTLGDMHSLVDEIEEFITGERHGADRDRVLATVLFTDIVGSTERAAELGDRRWRDTLAAHDDVVARELDRFRGRPVKRMGDGWLATFDGPARAIRCAVAARDGVRDLGIELRAGLHTGEIEVVGDDVAGLAVHIGARVGAAAGPGEVLVSSTVRDLVVGSGIEFTDRGSRALKGVPGEWRLHSVA
jgi:class 3 adenylate cyclase